MKSKMKNFIFALFISLVAMNAVAEECVILLHGMARTNKSMSKMEKQLSDAGYKVVNFDYPSTKYKIEVISKEYLPIAIEKCESAQRINFVTHSLGAIVLRKYLKDNTLENLNRVVMLGPPNKGSEVVDKLKTTPGFFFINGPAGMQLGTEETSFPNSLGPVSYEVGIIAGTTTINPLLSLMLPNPDDGKVSVARTKVEGMADHITVKVPHTFLMTSGSVIEQVKEFLKTGAFLRADVHH